MTHNIETLATYLSGVTDEAFSDDATPIPISEWQETVEEFVKHVERDFAAVILRTGSGRYEIKLYTKDVEFGPMMQSVVSATKLVNVTLVVRTVAKIAAMVYRVLDAGPAGYHWVARRRESGPFGDEWPLIQPGKFHQANDAAASAVYSILQKSNMEPPKPSEELHFSTMLAQQAKEATKAMEDLSEKLSALTAPQPGTAPAFVVQQPYATQKAAGLMLAMNSAMSGIPGPLAVERVAVDAVFGTKGTRARSNVTSIVRLISRRRKWEGVFARPCPVRPRHGFVDSREVRSAKALRELIAEMQVQDPDGELILSPTVKAALNLVGSRGGVSVGPGNSGATGGVGSAFYRMALRDVTGSTRREAGLAVTDEPFFEAVVEPLAEPTTIKANDDSRVNSGGRMLVTQLRGGPKMADGINATGIVKQRVDAVTAILHTEKFGLLQWEQRMQSLGKLRLTGDPTALGTVAWHPGGNPLSHYSIHAALNGVPILFDRKPELYDTVEVTSDGGSEVELDDRSVASGAVLGSILAAGFIKQIDLEAAGPRLLNLAAVALHQALVVGGSKRGSMMVGAGLAILRSLATAACIGEMRHAANGAPLRRLKNVMRRSGLTEEAVRGVVGSQFFKGRDNRNAIYNGALSNYSVSRQILPETLASFMRDTYCGASFGGATWATCAAMTMDLDAALMAVARGDKGAIKRAIERGHRLLNAVHNNGSLLNKFAEGCTGLIFDRAAQGSILTAMRAVADWELALFTMSDASAIIEEVHAEASYAPLHRGAVGALWSEEDGKFTVEQEHRVNWRIRVDGYYEQVTLRRAYVPTRRVLPNLNSPQISVRNKGLKPFDDDETHYIKWNDPYFALEVQAQLAKFRSETLLHNKRLRLRFPDWSEVPPLSTSQAMEEAVGKRAHATFSPRGARQREKLKGWWLSFTRNGHFVVYHESSPLYEAVRGLAPDPKKLPPAQPEAEQVDQEVAS